MPNSRLSILDDETSANKHQPSHGVAGASLAHLYQKKRQRGAHITLLTSDTETQLPRYVTGV